MKVKSILDFFVYKMISNNLWAAYKKKDIIKKIFFLLILFLIFFQDNYTALHLAVEAGKPAVVESVLGHGAQVHIRGM